MRKMKLQLDALSVESFAIDAEAPPRGTVDAYASSPIGCSAATLCGVNTCVKIATCDYTLCRVCPTV
jgi:hypothetical protein